MKYIALLALLALTACSTVSTSFQHPPAGDVQVSQVIHEPTTYIGQAVRWGGKIIAVHNDENSASIELVQFPLNRYGRPIATETSQGRFVVSSDSFIDPEVFQQDVMVTFLGNITGTKTLTIDQRELVVPVMSMTDSYRWIDKYTGKDRPYNPRQDAPFVGYGYYATGGYTP